MELPVELFVDGAVRHYRPPSEWYYHYQAALFLWALWKWEKAKKRGFYNRLDDRSHRDWIDRFYAANFTPMFPLKERTIGGYKFRQKTWYTPRHLGVDYRAAEGTEVYAPCDGEVLDIRNGFQAGVTLFFRPDGKDVTLRFCHLHPSVLKYAKPKRVSKGELIALTGNTGFLTTGAHLHLDISNGKSVLSGNLNIDNFIDPESWDWSDQVTVQVPVEVVPTPPAPEKFVIRIGKSRTNARNAPSVNAGVFQVLNPGDQVRCKGTTTGDEVNGSRTWFVTERSGKYIHSSLATRL